MICRHFVLECTIFLESKERTMLKSFFLKNNTILKAFTTFFLVFGLAASLFLAMVPLFVVLSRSIFYGMRGTERRRVLCCCCFRTVVWSFSPFFLCAVLLRHASGASHLLKNTNQILPTLVLLQGLLFFSFCKPALQRLAKVDLNVLSKNNLTSKEK